MQLSFAFISKAFLTFFVIASVLSLPSPIEERICLEMALLEWLPLRDASFDRCKAFEGGGFLGPLSTDWGWEGRNL